MVNEDVLTVFNIVWAGPRVEVVYADLMSSGVDGAITFWRDNKPIYVVNANAKPFVKAYPVGPAAEYTPAGRPA